VLLGLAEGRACLAVAAAAAAPRGVEGQCVQRPA
jgi:hypothetical protein